MDASFHNRVSAQLYPDGASRGHGTGKSSEEFVKDMKPELETEGAIGVCPAEETRGQQARGGHVRPRKQHLERGRM